MLQSFVDGAVLDLKRGTTLLTLLASSAYSELAPGVVAVLLSAVCLIEFFTTVTSLDVKVVPVKIFFTSLGTKVKLVPLAISAIDLSIVIS